MIYVPIEELLKKTGSVYKLVVLASLRTIELNGGAGKLVEVKPNTKLSNIALKEIREGKISYKIKAEKKGEK